MRLVSINSSRSRFPATLQVSHLRQSAGREKHISPNRRQKKITAVLLFLCQIFLLVYLVSEICLNFTRHAAQLKNTEAYTLFLHFCLLQYSQWVFVFFTFSWSVDHYRSQPCLIARLQSRKQPVLILCYRLLCFTQQWN